MHISLTPMSLATCPWSSFDASRFFRTWSPMVSGCAGMRTTAPTE
jgi:hypothetical protein